MHPYQPKKHHRRSIQLQRYDDSQEIFFKNVQFFY